jgi:hypothetical protein
MLLPSTTAITIITTPMQPSYEHSASIRQHCHWYIYTYATTAATAAAAGSCVCCVLAFCLCILHLSRLLCPDHANHTYNADQLVVRITLVTLYAFDSLIASCSPPLLPLLLLLVVVCGHVIPALLQCTSCYCCCF